MNSSVNSFLEWQKLLDIHESDLDFKNLIKSLGKWLKTKNLEKAKKNKWTLMVGGRGHIVPALFSDACFSLKLKC